LLRGYFIDLAGKKADILLSARIFEQVMGMKMSARPPSVGAFANNLREFESIRDFITSATITTLVDLPFIVFFLLVIWFIGGPMVFVPLVIIPIVLIYGWIIQAPLRKAVESSFRASAQKGATLIETLTGIETVKHLGAESALQRKWEQLTAHIAHWGVRSRLISSSAVNVAVFFQQFSQVAVVIFGVYLVTKGELSMGGLIASVMLTGRALGPMSQYANLAVRYFQAKTALSSLNGIMEMPIDRPEGKSFVSRPNLLGGIEFDGVSFNYPDEENKALKNVSFVIKPGERVAIIGRVGSGKTTIEKLMQGLFDPTEGAVRVDGTDMRQVDPADLRRNMGYVPQDVMLFFGSVKDNILMGAQHADDADILNAADLSGASEFVNRHPLGFDLPVGERGDNLSGGQRQSIAIARALVNDPPFLLMDEPTNSMDHTSEERLKKNLRDYVKNKTLVLVTHRASLLELVDRLIVMDSGRVMADGPKDQVLQSLRDGSLRGG
jgi:ATP-binding cassette subfamily C protein LapB